MMRLFYHVTMVLLKICSFCISKGGDQKRVGVYSVVFGCFFFFQNLFLSFATLLDCINYSVKLSRLLVIL